MEDRQGRPEPKRETGVVAVAMFQEERQNSNEESGDKHREVGTGTRDI